MRIAALPAAQRFARNCSIAIAAVKGASTTLSLLALDGTPVTDLSPLKDLPLQKIDGDFQKARDEVHLRAIKTLETINGKPAEEFWKDADKPAGSVP